MQTRHPLGSLLLFLITPPSDHEELATASSNSTAPVLLLLPILNLCGRCMWREHLEDVRMNRLVFRFRSSR